MKKRLLNNITLLLILGIFFQSCASFDKQLANPTPLHKDNLNELNGIYGIVATDFDSILVDQQEHLNRQVWNTNNFFTEIDRKLIKDTLAIDTLRTYRFGLQVLSPKAIQISYIENGNIFRERIVKTRLKRDGYLYLKNKNVQCMLVPIIAGAIDIKKARMTRSANGNLIFDVANFRYGAALVFIGDMRTWKYRLAYEPFE